MAGKFVETGYQKDVHYAAVNNSMLHKDISTTDQQKPLATTDTSDPGQQRHGGKRHGRLCLL